MQTTLVIAFLLGASVVVTNNESESPSVSDAQMRTMEQWSLTSSEYERFREALDGPFGYYTPNLEKNPILALGLVARTEEERARYARKHVAMEFEKNVAMVAFQLAVNRAWEEAYPTTPRFAYTDDTSHYRVSSLVGEDVEQRRITFTMTLNCTRCDSDFDRLYARAKNGGPAIDVYFAGEPPSTLIQAWARSRSISGADVNERRIVTLNFTSETYDAYPVVR